MKKLCRVVLGLYLLSVTLPVWAVVIEGNTPSGKFKSVFVTEEGRLPVAITTTTLQHVVVDSGTITSYQGGVWTVGTTALPATILTGNCGTVNGSGTVLTANPARLGMLACNQDMTMNVWFGGLGVTSLNAPVTPPGACFNPDEGAMTIYVGSLYAYTTGPMTVCWYEKLP
jgi:hypothetical protein